MDSLSAPFIKRPVMTMVLTLCVVIFGIIGFRRLPVNDLPPVEFPVINVSASYPGASPTTMANNIASPLERQFMQIPGLMAVTSQSTLGQTSLNLQFDLTKSVDVAAVDVQVAINQAMWTLPTDMPSPPIFFKLNPNARFVLYFALTSETLTTAQLDDFARSQIAQRISMLPGVANVAVYGNKSTVRVKASSSKLAAHGLTMVDVTSAIHASTTNLGAGQFDGPDRTLVLQSQGQLETAAEYETIIVSRKNGAVLYLKDVATITESVQDERTCRRFWSRGAKEPASNVAIAVYRQPGANTVEITERVKALLPKFQRELPSSVQLVTMMDSSKSIIDSVNDVSETLIIAFALVTVVIFIFLGRVRDMLIPVVALPLSMLITFLGIYLLGYSIDNLSLMALTLAIGFMVDDAIVFLENAVRRMESGETALRASLNGANEISFTILSMTLSLAIVFLPIVFLPGTVGRTFQEFAITIIIAIIASGVVSLTLTPLMCARMLAGHETGEKTWLERKVNRVLSYVLKRYGTSLHFFLRHKWMSALAWVICLVGTVALFKAVPKSLLPIGDSSFVSGRFNLQEGTSPERMREYQNKVMEVFRSNESVEMVSTSTGKGGTGAAVTFMSILKPVGKRPAIEAVCAQLAQEMWKIPGGIPVVQPSPVLSINTGVTSTTLGRYTYAVSGLNPDEVNADSAKLMAKLSDYPGFLSLNTDKQTQTPMLQIDVLRNQANSYGISAQTVLATIRNAYTQNYAYIIKKATDQYQVILEASDAERCSPEQLEKLYVRANDATTLVPLRAVATWKEIIGPQSVNHINQFPTVNISFALKPGVTIGEAAKFIEETAAASLSSDVWGALKGEAQTFQETIDSSVYLLGFAIFAMYAILAILYESYVHPITVLTGVPVAAVGGLATLLLFHEELSLYAIVGLFLLIGLVKKNGIMMVDFALLRMAEGRDCVSAVHEASIERFRPIMMTTFAALMGALPLAMGFGADGSSRRPLGLIIVGGLVISQLITLYITPALFLYLEAFQENVLDQHSFFRSHRARHVNIEQIVKKPEAVVSVSISTK